MTKIVTGGAGFIGSHLVEKLLLNGDDVIAIDDLSRGNISNLEKAKLSKNFRFVEGNLSSIDFAISTIRDADTVYHLAAINGTRFFSEKPRLVMQTNIKTTENVLEAANRNGIKKVVFASSSEVYGHPEEFPTSETSRLVFDSPEVARWSYALSKLYDEHLCFAYTREFGLQTIILRFFNTYGPRLIGTPYGQVVSIFITCVLSGRNVQVFGSGEQTRSFSYISDTIDGIVLSSSPNFQHPEIFNIGNAEEVTIKNLADKVIDVCGRGTKDVKIEYLPAIAGDTSRRCPSLLKAQKLLGFNPKISLDEGLRTTVEWFKERSV